MSKRNWNRARDRVRSDESDDSVLLIAVKAHLTEQGQLQLGFIVHPAIESIMTGVELTVLEVNSKPIVQAVGSALVRDFNDQHPDHSLNALDSKWGRGEIWHD